MNLTWLRIAFSVTLAFFGTLSAVTEPRLLPVYPRPQEQILPVGVISTGQPYQVLIRRLEWTLVRQGAVRGWIHSADWISLPRPGAALDPPEPVSPPIASESATRQDWASHGGLEGLLNFALGDREQVAKMSDPFHRHRVSSVADSWGPLYYRRTRDYYVRGIYLWDLDEERIRLGLFKRRLYYENLLGSLGSEHALASALNSAPGWQSNRDIFGRGREYYFELSIHF